VSLKAAHDLLLACCLTNHLLNSMDFVRLGLERGSTAREALEVIIQLLERHGQGGNCGFDHKVYYHNAFMIVDRHEAWVLGTFASE
jgi:secernin